MIFNYLFLIKLNVVSWLILIKQTHKEIIIKMNSSKENNLIKTLGLLKNSYSPYSNFKVASFVITKDNKFFGGVNVENSSYV